MQRIEDKGCPLFCYEPYGICAAHEAHVPSIVERLDYCLTGKYRSCPLHSVKGARKIRVVYHDDTSGLVDKQRLDELIWQAQIKMFYRTDGWAVIGCSPLRVRRSSYEGLERRGIL
ncbi:MAG: GSU3473 family protein [Nitrospirota bacterium]